jgi:hypothetical protein
MTHGIVFSRQPLRSWRALPLGYSPGQKPTNHEAAYLCLKMDIAKFGNDTASIGNHFADCAAPINYPYANADPAKRK